MQSLLLLRQSHQQGFLDGSGLALNGDLVRIGTAADALFEQAAEETIVFAISSDQLGEVRLPFEYKAGLDVLPPSTDGAPTTRKRLGAGVVSESLFTDDFHYLNAERLGPRTAFEFSEYQAGQHRQLGSQGEYTAYFLNRFGDEPVEVEGLVRPEAKSISLRDQVEAWLAPICPGIRVNLTAAPGMDLMNLQYSMQLERGVSNQYRSTNVGFGVTYVLPILVAVLSSRPKALILLENPEVHLHPRGQSVIGQLLSRAATAGIQIMVETHSDHVLNGMRLAVHDGALRPDDLQLHFFSRDSKGTARVVSPRIDRDGRIDPWPEDFFDEWDRSLDGLLQPGPSDPA